jgi:hypothetical protein
MTCVILPFALVVVAMSIPGLSGWAWGVLVSASVVEREFAIDRIIHDASPCYATIIF